MVFWPGRQASESARCVRAVRGLYRRAKEGDTPSVRGLRLLRSWLSPEQLAQFDAFGYFDVTGSDSGKKYRIKFGMCANIQEFGDDGAPRWGWCFVPDNCQVPGDVMLAQKIALETGERAALAVANKFGACAPVAARGDPFAPTRRSPSR
jgi:hypothetical protein